MQIRARLKGASRDWDTGRWNITLELTEGNINELDKLKDKDLAADIKIYRKHRSKSANGMLWALIGQIAEALHADKWDVYLSEIKKHGKFVLIETIPEAVEDIKKQWREVEDIGPHTVNGTEMRQLLCYFGSSTYNTKEFSVLLDDVIEDIKELGLEAPTSEDMRRALEELENG